MRSICAHSDWPDWPVSPPVSLLALPLFASALTRVSPSAASVQHHAPLTAHCIQGTSIVHVLIMERIIEWYCDDCHIAITLFTTGLILIFVSTHKLHYKQNVHVQERLTTSNDQTFAFLCSTRIRICQQISFGKDDILDPYA